MVQVAYFNMDIAHMNEHSAALIRPNAWRTKKGKLIREPAYPRYGWHFQSVGQLICCSAESIYLDEANIGVEHCMTFSS